MSKSITFTKTVAKDLETFYKFQLNEEACYLAAFTAKDAQDRAAYIEKYKRFLTDPMINMLTIHFDGKIAGSIAKFLMHGDAEVTYWIDKDLWGKGIATAALKNLLKAEKVRPIYGRTAFDNFGSQRVLENCGFIKVGTDRGFAHARQAEIEEYIYELAQ